MELIVNGEKTDYQGENTLAALIESRGHSGKVAVALNGAFVPRTTYEDVELKEGDDIEIVAPMQGG